MPRVFLEAKLNEEVAIARICFDEGPDERKRWDEIKEGERRNSVPQKSFLFWVVNTLQAGEKFL